MYAWAFEQAQLLRLGRFSELDLPNVIEEIESLGREVRLQLSFYYRDLMAYLLEWQSSPENQTAELRKAILECRFGIETEEKDAKSLRDAAKQTMRECYAEAVALAMMATGLPRECFPIECPFTVDFLRNMDAMPDVIEKDRA